MRASRGFVFLCTGLVLFAGFAAEAGTGPKIIKMNCDRGERIRTALIKGQNYPDLLIVVYGTCHEDVVIDRNNLTLMGATGATVVAALSTAILLDGVSNVSIENLTVQGGPEEPGEIGGAGIMVWFSTGVSVSDLVVEKRPGLEEEGKGMLVVGSEVVISDSTFQNNNSYGLQGVQSSLFFLGDVELLNNRFEGILLSLQSSLISLSAIRANGNGDGGIILWENSSAGLLGPVEVTGNDVAGIGAESGSLVRLSDVEAYGNENGMMALTGGQIHIEENGRAYVHNNTLAGLSATDGGFFEFYGTVEENGTDGVYLHGSSATFHNVTIQGNTPDVNLLFGSRVVFEGDNTVDDVACDSTVLVEGDVSCP